MIWIYLAVVTGFAGITGWAMHSAMKEATAEEPELWTPAHLHAVELEVLAPLDAPECPKVDSAWMRSEMAREEYERAALEAHAPYSDAVPAPEWVRSARKRSKKRSRRAGFRK